MGIDASIPLGIKPIQAPNILGLAQNALNLGNSQQQLLNQRANAAAG
jgi:hypothetical protein